MDLEVRRSPVRQRVLEDQEAASRGERYERPIARIECAPNIREVSEEDRAALQVVYDGLRSSLRRP
jgi:hypothetical protein